MCVYSQVSYSETSNDFCTMYQAAFSNMYSDCSPSDVWADELLSSFTSVCSNILDYIVPLKTRCFKSKSEPWLNNSTRAACRLCRRAEHKLKKDKFQVSYEIFKNRLSVCMGYDVSIQTCVNFRSYFSNKISDIRSSIQPSDHDPSVPLLTCPAVLHQFEPISIASLKEIVEHLRPSTGPQDIIPTHFLKQFFFFLYFIIFFYKQIQNKIIHS